jgi:hypothetical protein
MEPALVDLETAVVAVGMLLEKAVVQQPAIVEAAMLVLERRNQQKRMA